MTAARRRLRLRLRLPRWLRARRGIAAPTSVSPAVEELSRALGEQRGMTLEEARAAIRRELEDARVALGRELP